MNTDIRTAKPSTFTLVANSGPQDRIRYITLRVAFLLFFFFFLRAPTVKITTTTRPSDKTENKGKNPVAVSSRFDTPMYLDRIWGQGKGSSKSGFVARGRGTCVRGISILLTSQLRP